MSVSGPYTEVATNIGNRLVDIIESDTSCLTSTSNTCLYGGENIKNYVQYPENEDKTKNLWRIIGSYQIDDQTLPKLISQSTTSTSTSTLTTDLTSFYNTLEDKEVLVQETNKFNCFTNTCAESTYNNIGLLTAYEYNQIGGVNSYLTSNENYYINTSTSIKEVTSSGITNSSTTSGLKPTIYLQTGVQVTGSGTVSDPYIISPSSDINLVSYTLNGQTTNKTYADLLKTNVVKNVTCKNGTTATWDNTDFSIKLNNIHTPDYCTIDFGDGYSVSLTATNGTVSPSNITVGYGGSASFTVTPNSEYKLELETNTCGGTLSGNTYTISNITSGKSCSITFKSSTPTLYAKLLTDKTKRPNRGSFSSILTSNNTNTLYTSTENGTTVYYFAGNAQDNWVKFGKNASNQDLYWRIIRTNSDGGVRLLYHGTSTTATDAVINTSTAFNSSVDNIAYVSYMYGSTGSIANARANTTNSTIKTTIDNWYTSNLEAKDYTKYLSRTAVYCNDRSTSDNKYFGARTRLDTNKTPTYDCATIEDKFTADSSTGNGKLTYPIALMTADEVSFAGGLYENNAPTWYYYNSANGSSTGDTWWWLLSPDYWYGGNAHVFVVGGSSYPGYLSFSYVIGTHGVRPAISLKSCIKYSTGNGSANAPYTIKETETGC